MERRTAFALLILGYYGITIGSVLGGGEVHLSGGSSPNEGFLEVLLDGEWGRVCWDWMVSDEYAGHIVCQQLGYRGLDAFISFSAGHESFYQNVHVAIGEISCTGMEESIKECSLGRMHCPSKEFAAMRCTEGITDDAHSQGVMQEVGRLVLKRQQDLPSSDILPTPPAATSSAGHKLTGSQATPVMSPTAKTAANQDKLITRPLMIGMTTGLTVIVLILVVSLTICMVAIAATCRRYYVSQMKKEILSLESFPVEAKGSEVAKRRDFPTRGHHHKKWTSQHMLRMSSVQTLDVEWEMNFSLLQLKEKLGSGAFGSVYKAVVADDTTVLESSVVAVKLLRDVSPQVEKTALLAVIELMKDLDNHPHLVRLLGCCTKGDHLALIMQYMPNGNLKDYLVKSRETKDDHLQMDQSDSEGKYVTTPVGTIKCGDPRRPLTTIKLLTFARQIAMGMEYLSMQKIVHRDLAARKVLIDKHWKMKISDFGLSQDSYEALYYERSEGKLPLRWMAIESIVDRQFSIYSDVWSFGVVLWEIITLGALPYLELMTNSDVCEKLKEGYRMTQPSNCPNELYHLMLDCWKAAPSERPTFTTILERLDTIIAHDEEATDIDGDSTSVDSGNVSNNRDSLDSFEEELAYSCATEYILIEDD